MADHQMRRPQDRFTATDLADRLFVPQERFGWQYVEPTPIRPSPLMKQQPYWNEPEPPDLRQLEHQRLLAGRKVPLRLVIVIVVALFAGALEAVYGLIVFVVGGGLVLAPLISRSLTISRITREAGMARDLEHNAYQNAKQQWLAQTGAHDQAERERHRSALLWYPLHVRAHISRVDVFGGTGDGWASLLATMGASMLHSGSSILVLDFSEQDVAAGLGELALRQNLRVGATQLSNDLGAIDLCSGLDADDLTDLIADAAMTMRSQPDSSLRTLDGELLSVVCKRLAQPITVAKVVAGLRVLRRTYDAGEPNAPLSRDELRDLNRQVDLVGQADRVQQELQFLTGMLDQFAKDTAAPGGPWSLWPVSGLEIVSTSSRRRHTKDVLDRLLFHRLLHDLRETPRNAGRTGDIAVVAGADHIGLEALENLAKEARRQNVRLVLFLEHLRGDLQQFLGGSDSAAIVMRLGNAQEANTAAEFIGRGHKFVLSQVTRQFGQTVTTGTSDSKSEQEGRSTSDSENTSRTHAPGLFNTSFTSGRSVALTESWSRSWQHTITESTAESTTMGTTEARVYEFSVEPTEIQGLPPTAFVLVEPTPSGRQVATGDCNPGVTLMERVAAEPLRR